MLLFQSYLLPSRLCDPLLLTGRLLQNEYLSTYLVKDYFGEHNLYFHRDLKYLFFQSTLRVVDSFLHQCTMFSWTHHLQKSMLFFYCHVIPQKIVYRGNSYLLGHAIVLYRLIVKLLCQTYLIYIVENLLKYEMDLNKYHAFIYIRYNGKNITYI